MTWQNLAEDILGEFASRAGHIEADAFDYLSFGKPPSLRDVENRAIHASVKHLSRQQYGSCNECGRAFTLNASNQVLCSHGCRVSARRVGQTPMAGMCEWCGEYYQRTHSTGRPARFCCTQCKRHHWNHHNKRKYSSRAWNERVSAERRARREAAVATCGQCGVQFKPNRKRAYCTVKCYRQADKRLRHEAVLRQRAESCRRCAVCSKDISQRKLSAILCGAWACAYRSKKHQASSSMKKAEPTHASCSTTAIGQHESNRE